MVEHRRSLYSGESGGHIILHSMCTHVANVHSVVETNQHDVDINNNRYPQAEVSHTGHILLPPPTGLCVHRPWSVCLLFSTKLQILVSYNYNRLNFTIKNYLHIIWNLHIYFKRNVNCTNTFAMTYLWYVTYENCVARRRYLGHA